MEWSRFNDATFLSILRDGETLIVGVDFPMPLIVKINAPTKNQIQERSQNDKIKTSILAKCLLYLLFGKRA